MRMKRLWSAGFFFLTLSLLSAAEDQWNIYYAERFPTQISLTGKRDNPWYRNVRQTPCWRLCRDVVIAGPPPSAWISKQRFLVSSEIPLEYVFYRTLLEDTLYRYKLECCLSGRGIVRLQEKHHGIKKDMSSGVFSGRGQAQHDPAGECAGNFPPYLREMPPAHCILPG